MSRWVFRFVVWGIVVLICAPVGASPERNIIFSYRDRRGDDVGPGSYLYPTDDTFAPHLGLLDLTAFQVTLEGNDVVFSFTFAALANPWNAPEGFYHPRIDLFINSDASLGRTEPLRPGPGDVQFNPNHPWDMWLRVAPWDGAALYSYQDDPESPGRQQGIGIRTDEAAATIHVVVSQDVVPIPRPDWHYYVLVGSFDALGVDGYRPVQPQPSRWLLGGAVEGDVRIVDLAAPSMGRQTQGRQLNPPPGTPVLLHPIGPPHTNWRWSLLAIAVVIPLLWLTVRRRRST